MPVKETGKIKAKLLFISVLAESPIRNDFKVDKYYMRGLSERMSFTKLLS